MKAIAFCVGRDKFDAHPELHTVPSFDQFRDYALAIRSPRKGLTYFCAPMRGNGDARPHRGKSECLSRRYVAFDLDGGVTAEEFAEVRLWFMRYSGFGYTTASSTEDKPRARFVIELDRELSREEAWCICLAIERDLTEEFGKMAWDASVYRGEQPVYAPTQGALTFTFMGEPVDTQLMLLDAPLPEQDQHRGAGHVDPDDDPIIVQLTERKLYVRPIGPGQHEIICPFVDAHSDGDRTGTRYFQKHYNGYATANFKCHHRGCEARTKDDFLDALGLGTGEFGESGEEPRQHEQPGEPEHWPCALADEAYYGIAGEIVRAIEPHSESDPAAILAQVLVAFGVTLGRSPHVKVEGDQHTGNLFALLVGETSKGRKGTSWGRVHNLFKRLSSWPKVVSGLSSGEGLKWQVRDPVIELVKDKKFGGYAEEIKDRGIDDKRLLVIESEFAHVLRVIARQGNTLSATVRSAWDTGNLSTLTKNDPTTASGAHIAIVGHITAAELRAELTQTDSANGFANRFLFVCVKRSKCLPFGGDTLHETVLDGFANRLALAVEAARTVTEITMTPAARAVWAAIYPRLSEGHAGLFGAATGRAEAQTLRLAELYALLDQSAHIDAPHLIAALAVWEFAQASARYVFGSSLGDPIADEILRSLRLAGNDGLTRTQISDLFKRHQPAERIGAALDVLKRRGFARPEQRQTNGRPSEVWVAAK